MATSTVENYLKAILHLQEGNEVPTVGRIAEELGVTPGTVTTMMRNLSDEGLIDYIPRKGLKLRSSAPTVQGASSGLHESLWKKQLIRK